MKNEKKILDERMMQISTNYPKYEVVVKLVDSNDELFMVVRSDGLLKAKLLEIKDMTGIIDVSDWEVVDENTIMIIGNVLKRLKTEGNKK